MTKLLTPNRLDLPMEVTYDTTLKISVRLREAVDRSIYLYGSLEYATTRLLHLHVVPGMCVLDVGANIGYYSLLAGKRVGSTGVVHAFEPNIDVFQKLEANIRRNAYLNVRAHPVAVCDRDGPMRFYATLSKDNSGTSSLIAPSCSFLAQEVVVPGVTLDQFMEVNGIYRVDLMKIDVEGAERDVFRGAARLLERRGAPDIIFECHGDGAAIDCLRDAGYQIYTIQHHRSPAAVLTPISISHNAGGNRPWEAPNLFATKELPARLRQLVAIGTV